MVVDLDDTLCLTEAACFVMENEVLAQMGLSPMSREVHISTWGKPLFEAILLRSPGLDLAKFKKLYRPVINEFTKTGKLDSIPQDNLEALDKLIKDNKLVMILTSRTHEELHHLLEPDHLLAKRVSTFYYRDNMQFHKPDPRAFNELLRDNNLNPEECIYIGDSVSDAVAAKQAGLHFIASLESGLRAKSDFSHLPVDIYINKFPEVYQAVQSLDKSV